MKIFSLKKTAISIIVLISLSATLLLVFLLLDFKSPNTFVNEWENNYQYGPTKKFKKESESKDKNIDYFFGASEFNFATYKDRSNSLEAANEQIYFNGNLKNVKRTPINNKPLKVWKDDTQNEQIILFKEKTNSKITNLEVNFIESEYDNLELNANFIKPIKAKNSNKSQFNPASYKGVFYNFDEIGTNNIEYMKFDFQPILFSVTTNKLTMPGLYDAKLNVKYFDEEHKIEKNFNVSKKIEVKNKVISQEDLNIKEFGSDSMSFPGTSQKFILKQFDKVITNRTINLKNQDPNEVTEDFLLKELKANNKSMPSDTYVADVQALGHHGLIKEDEQGYFFVVGSNEYMVSNKNSAYYNETIPKEESNYLRINVITSKIKERISKLSDNVYDKPIFNKGSATNVVTKPENNYSRITNYRNTLPEFLNYDEEQLPGENRSLDNKYGKLFEDLHKENNAKYGYVPNFGLPYIKYIGTNNTATNVKDFWGDVDQANLTSIFNTEKISWELNFDILDQYIEFLADHNYEKVFIPVVARNTNPFNFLYKTNNEKINSSGGDPKQKVLARVMIKDAFIESNTGYASTLFNQFIEHMMPKIAESLTNHIDSERKSGNASYNKIEFFYSFDETKKEINSRIINKFEAIDPERKLIKNHAYVGWQFKANDPMDVNELETIFDDYDEITLQQREYLKNYEDASKQKQEEFKEMVERRKQKNQHLRFYSSWNNFPGGYLSSVPSDLVFATFLSYKYGANGFDRFGLDSFDENDISLDGVIKGNKHEPGDNFIVYPGDKKNVHKSLRLVNIQNANKYIWKLYSLNKSKEITDNEVKIIKDYINWNLDLNSNTNNKWSEIPNYSVSINDFISSKNHTMYQQVENLKTYINSF